MMAEPVELVVRVGRRAELDQDRPVCRGWSARPVLGVPRPAPPVGSLRLRLTVRSPDGGVFVASGIVKVWTVCWG